MKNNDNQVSEEKMLQMEGELLDLQLSMQMGLLKPGDFGRIKQLKEDIIRNL